MKAAAGTICREAEVVIVGAGPAGSALACRLARLGREVLLVDRGEFPRPKPCGECMNPGAVAALARAGLLDVVRATHPVPLRGWSLRTTGGRRVWAEFPEGTEGYGIDRSTLDFALLEEARRCGVEVREGIHVREVDPAVGGGWAEAWGSLPDGGAVRLRGRFLVGADGLRSAVAREIGAVRRIPRLRKASLTWRIRGSGPAADRGYLLLGGDWTVGLAPVPHPAEGRVADEGGDAEDTCENCSCERDPWAGCSYWNATLVVESPRRGGGLRHEGWNRLVHGLELIASGSGCAPGSASRGEDAAHHGWREGPVLCGGPWASGPFDRPIRTAGSGRVLLVGDAAGYYDPLTGQGMFRALRSAELAAGVIGDALLEAATEPSALAPAGLRRYDRMLRRAFAPGRGLQRVIESILATEALREPVFALLEWRPGLAALLIRVLGDLGLGRLERPSEWSSDANGG